jgi:PilZ domain
MAHDRRQYPRSVVHPSVVVSLGECKVGLLFDLSEGGLSVHGLSENRGLFDFVAFESPKGEDLIVARTEIAWTSGTVNRTGLRFLQVGDKSREQLRDWLSAIQRFEDPLRRNL